MPRASDGTVTLVTGNPVVDDTAITADWANLTIADLAAMIQDSLSRRGEGGMIGTLQFADGTLAAPGIAFILAPNTGIRRVAADDTVRLVSNGVDGVIVSSSGITTDQVNSTAAVITNIDVVSIDRAGTITIGGTSGTTITIGRTGQTVSMPGTVNTGALTGSTLTSNGNVSAPSGYISASTTESGTITLATGWGLSGVGSNGFRLRRSAGIAYLRGTATAGAGASWGTVMTLPGGFQPAGGITCYQAAVVNRSGQILPGIVGIGLTGVVALVYMLDPAQGSPNTFISPTGPSANDTVSFTIAFEAQ